MKITCPFCGKGEVEAIEGAAIEGARPEDLFPPGAPSPHQLYEQTGGGPAYIDAMIEHGYVIRKPKP